MAISIIEKSEMRALLREEAKEVVAKLKEKAERMKSVWTQQTQATHTYEKKTTESTYIPPPTPPSETLSRSSTKKRGSVEHTCILSCSSCLMFASWLLRMC